jgi:hypothetical protein
MRRISCFLGRHRVFSQGIPGQSAFLLNAVSGYGISAASAVGIACFLKESRGKALFYPMPSRNATYQCRLWVHLADAGRSKKPGDIVSRF